MCVVSSGKLKSLFGRLFSKKKQDGEEQEAGDFNSVIVCCSVMHCVAVCCGVLQCVAMCCSVLY